MRRSLHHFTISLTSAVVRGRSTVVERPWYLFIQSLLYGESSAAGAENGGSVESMDEAGRILAKCATSASVTLLNRRLDVACDHRRRGVAWRRRAAWR